MRTNDLLKRKKRIQKFINNSIWFGFGFGSAMFVMALCIKELDWLIYAASVISITAIEAVITKEYEN